VALQPAFNPIENGLAKLKEHLRKGGAPHTDAQWFGIYRRVDAMTHCGVRQRVHCRRL
jgi:hypothetical protein